MPSFRNKPTIVEAVQWNGDANIANQLLGERYGVDWEYVECSDLAISISTTDGKMNCKLGDWLIRGDTCRYHTCRHDVFVETYESVEGVN